MKISDAANATLAQMRDTLSTKTAPEFVTIFNAIDRTTLIPNEAERNEFTRQVVLIISEFMHKENSGALCSVRGDLYHELGEAQLAEKDIIQWAESNYLPAWGFNRLGNFYAGTGRIEDAIAAFKHGIKKSRKEAWNYMHLGDLYKIKGNIRLALKTYERSIRVNPKFSWGYYELAQIFSDKGLYEEAANAYRKILEIGNSPFLEERASAALKEIEARLSSPIYERVSALIDNIKSHLETSVDDIYTHYTALSTAKNLVLSESNFRLSEATYLNDTSEGQPLFKFLNLSEHLSHRVGESSQAFATKPFIGSFVPARLENDLTLWRMYGKESKAEAEGCNLTFSGKKFIDSIAQYFVERNSEPNNGSPFVDLVRKEFRFYRVAYIGDEKITVDGNAESSKNVYNSLVDLRQELGKITFNLPVEIRERLADIAFLFKTSQFQHESEVRLVLSGIGFQPKVDLNFEPPKVYIELAPISPAIGKVTLGPKVTKSEEWAAAFHYTMKNRNQQAVVEVSRLPYK